MMTEIHILGDAFINAVLDAETPHWPICLREIIDNNGIGETDEVALLRAALLAGMGAVKQEHVINEFLDEVEATGLSITRILDTGTWEAYIQHPSGCAISAEFESADDAFYDAYVKAQKQAEGWETIGEAFVMPQEGISHEDA